MRTSSSVKDVCGQCSAWRRRDDDGLRHRAIGESVDCPRDPSGTSVLRDVHRHLVGRGIRVEADLVDQLFQFK